MTEGESPARGAIHARRCAASKLTEAEGQWAELETNSAPSSPLRPRLRFECLGTQHAAPGKSPLPFPRIYMMIQV